MIKKASLKKYNTFGIDVAAKQLAIVKSIQDLQELLQSHTGPYFVLGGGSNLLLTKDVEKLVIKNEIKGIELIRTFKHRVYVAIGGGENWHQFVLWCLKKNLGGVENLSLIPGTVGAAPIQNIGAYGVELKDVFHKLEALNLTTGKIEIFRLKDCKFAYRDSVFKKKLKGKYCITRVYLKLTRPHAHRLKMNYGAIQKTLAEKRINKPTIKDISKAVIAIRSRKLPDPQVLGNSGSFFKNPEISKKQFLQLQKQFPDIVFYELPKNKVKVPAGWLIEQCGWKGKRVGNTGAHAQQALVLVNYDGKAKGKEVEKLAYRIIDSVEQKFGITLTPEVNIL